MTNPLATKIKTSQVDFIDFILANIPLSFCEGDCLFTGLLDCYKLVLSVFKTIFSKSKPTEIT